MLTATFVLLAAWFLASPTGAQTVLVIDADGDGYPAIPAIGSDTVPDCNDLDASINPGKQDRPYDGIDQDCDRHSDDDADRDGYDAEQQGGTDCDDTNDAIRPGVVENWYNGIDEDCAGDDDFDADGDGERAIEYASNRHDTTGMADCDDSNARVGSQASEIRGDARDNDCDGRVE